MPCEGLVQYRHAIRFFVSDLQGEEPVSYVCTVRGSQHFRRKTRTVEAFRRHDKIDSG